MIETICIVKRTILHSKKILGCLSPIFGKTFWVLSIFYPKLGWNNPAFFRV